MSLLVLFDLITVSAASAPANSRRTRTLALKESHPHQPTVDLRLWVARVRLLADRTLKATAWPQLQISRAPRQEDELINAWLPKDRRLHETSFCSKRTFTIRTVSKTCNYYSTPPPPPFTSPCHGPIWAAVSQWSMENCRNCPVADQPGDTYENKIIIFMLFLKEEIEIRIITLFIGNNNINISVV